MRSIIITGIVLCFSFYGSKIIAQSAGEAVAKKVGVYVFPAKGQSTEQQQKDESDCYTWAVQQSGYDPINPTKVQAQQVQGNAAASTVGGSAGGAAVGAAIGAVCGDAGKGAAIGAICGDAGKGAAVGAVAGALRGRRARVVGQHMEQGAANEEAAQQNQGMENNFKKAFSACLEGKGYTVK